MPLNKEAFIRYRAINKCLKNNKKVTKQELIEACNKALDGDEIKERTLASDIKDMREDSRLGFYAPIVYDRTENIYYYDDPNYSIDNIPINKEELKILSFIAKMLDQYKDVSIFNAFSSVVRKIEDAIRIKRFQEIGTTDFIEFEIITETKGSEFLEPLIQAIDKKKVIRLTYKKFQDLIPTVHYIHPYLLKEYRNRWYLLGYNEKYKEIRTYSLDRIVGIMEDDLKTYRNSRFDPKDYFKYTIGIAALEDVKPELVKLKISKDIFPYIKTLPIHASQQIVEEKKDYVIISLHVIHNIELESIILGWGSHVEVLEPQELRENIKTVFEDALKRYF